MAKLLKYADDEIKLLQNDMPMILSEVTEHRKITLKTIRRLRATIDVSNLNEDLESELLEKLNTLQTFHIALKRKEKNLKPTPVKKLSWKDLETETSEVLRAGLIPNLGMEDPDDFFKCAFRNFSNQLKPVLREDGVRVNVSWRVVFRNTFAQTLEQTFNVCRVVKEKFVDLKQWYGEYVWKEFLGSLKRFQEQYPHWSLAEIVHLKVEFAKGVVQNQDQALLKLLRKLNASSAEFKPNIGMTNLEVGKKMKVLDVRKTTTMYGPKIVVEVAEGIVYMPVRYVTLLNDEEDFELMRGRDNLYMESKGAAGWSVNFEFSLEVFPGHYVAFEGSKMFE